MCTIHYGTGDTTHSVCTRPCTAGLTDSIYMFCRTTTHIPRNETQIIVARYATIDIHITDGAIGSARYRSGVTAAIYNAYPIHPQGFHEGSGTYHAKQAHEGAVR